MSETGFEGWKNGIDRANGEWDLYDPDIQRIVLQYNMHLRDTPHFRPLDWRLVKAMLSTESGPHRKEWKTKPLQIGVRGDPGLNALLYGNEGSELVVPPCCVLNAANVTANPRMNVAAAVGYLLMRMADYGVSTVRDGPVFEVNAGVGDSLASLARKNRSTVETMQKLNPGVHIIRQGQTLKCQRASIQKVIVGWKLFAYSTVARRYNGNGQPSGDAWYAKKLEYAHAATKKIDRR